MHSQSGPESDLSIFESELRLLFLKQLTLSRALCLRARNSIYISNYCFHFCKTWKCQSCKADHSLRYSSGTSLLLFSFMGTERAFLREHSSSTKAKTNIQRKFCPKCKVESLLLTLTKPVSLSQRLDKVKEGWR